MNFTVILKVDDIMRGFFAMLSRMKYIDRWGLMRSTREENLSEHTLEVAMLTHALIAIANERLGEDLNAGEGVLYALYHDAPEIITGDLPTPIKYHDPAIKEAYKIAQPNDVVLVAGKGHEDYQILAEETIHFDDREKVREIFG